MVEDNLAIILLLDYYNLFLTRSSVGLCWPSTVQIESYHQNWTRV